MRDDGYVLAPFSFAKFCLDYPSDCPTVGGASRIALTPARLAELSSINRSVNARIAPTRDSSRLRYWRLNVAAGDCNSFAVQKRHELMIRGWPAAALSLTVVKTGSGEGHLVVTVRTDRGDLVLDNLRSQIVSWRQAGYWYIMRQSDANPQFWVELHGGRVGQTYTARSVDTADAAAEPSRATRPDDIGADISVDQRGAKSVDFAIALARAGEIFEDFTSSLVRADEIAASAAPTVHGAVADFLRLANAQLDTARPTGAPLRIGSIDPTGFGSM